MDIGMIKKVSLRELWHKEDLDITLINEMSNFVKKFTIQFSGKATSGF